ncbi:hypothetical protein YC2023_079125 [Brassica napus]
MRRLLSRRSGVLRLIRMIVRTQRRLLESSGVTDLTTHIRELTMSHCIWTQEWASSFRGILQTTSNLFSEHLTSMIGVKCMVFTEF